MINVTQETFVHGGQDKVFKPYLFYSTCRTNSYLINSAVTRVYNYSIYPFPQIFNPQYFLMWSIFIPDFLCLLHVLNSQSLHVNLYWFFFFLALVSLFSTTVLHAKLCLCLERLNIPFLSLLQLSPSLLSCPSIF